MGSSRELFYGSALYHLMLWRPPRRSIALRLPVRWPGDAERGAALLGGHFAFAGETVESATPPWDGPHGEDFRAALHGFAWLRDLAALGDAKAARAARAWTADWLARYPAYEKLAWRGDVLGNRLQVWLEHLDLVLDPTLAASFARQARHLAKVAGFEGEGLARLRAVRGLVAAQAALGGRRPIEQALTRLRREITYQLFADGVHRSRSPAGQLAALRLLVDARAALAAARHNATPAVEQAIERAALMVRFFRHGDGGFALFNGADEASAAMIDLVLSRAPTRGMAPATAADGGFERLQAGGTVVLMDCGAPAAPGFDRAAHAGALSIEMSHGAERIVVNCGAGESLGGAWPDALRATAAHSTLIVADTSSAELRLDGSFGPVPRAAPPQRAEQAGDLWVAATHEGYRAKFGLTHGRQIFLTADGNELRGEDSLTGEAGRAFVIRFHLHPDVTAELAPDGKSAYLHTPSGLAWSFGAEGAVLSAAESVYVGTGAARKTSQLLLDGHVGTHGARVRWLFRREGPLGA